MTLRDGCLEIDTPVGPLLLAASAEGLTHLLFARPAGGSRKPPPGPPAADPAAAARILAEAKRQLGEYFAGRRRDFDLPLAPRGTDFQRAVWRALGDIPYGRTESYGELARRLGRPRAVRAVGAANGANPIAIIVPCHRVIGSDRRLTGYGGGLAVKKKLLELEGARFGGWSTAQDRPEPKPVSP